MNSCIYWKVIWVTVSYQKYFLAIFHFYKSIIAQFLNTGAISGLVPLLFLSRFLTKSKVSAMESNLTSISFLPTRQGFPQSFLQICSWQMLWRAFPSGGWILTRVVSSLHHFIVVFVKCNRNFYTKGYFPRISLLWNSLLFSVRWKIYCSKLYMQGRRIIVYLLESLSAFILSRCIFYIFLISYLHSP